MIGRLEDQRDMRAWLHNLTADRREKSQITNHKQSSFSFVNLVNVICNFLGIWCLRFVISSCIYASIHLYSYFFPYSITQSSSCGSDRNSVSKSRTATISSIVATP